VSVVFSMPPWRTVHESELATRNGRHFDIDIYRDSQGRHESTVTVYEIGSAPGWVFPIDPAAKPPGNDFKSALEWIQVYLKQVDPSDEVTDINNPCNCPFVSQTDQTEIAAALGITAPVRVK
jgi:hypothetical protein